MHLSARAYSREEKRTGKKKEVQAEKMVSIALISRGAKWFWVPGQRGAPCSPVSAPQPAASRSCFAPLPVHCLCGFALFIFFLSQKNSKRNSVAAACDKPLPLSHAATCRGPQHRPGSGMGSQRRARVWDEILEIWANEALQGGRSHAFGVASAWSPIQVPPSCAFLALPTVSSPQHRPATSPSWQESQGANKRAVPLVFKHTSAGARG